MTDIDEDDLVSVLPICILSGSLSCFSAAAAQAQLCYWLTPLSSAFIIVLKPAAKLLPLAFAALPLFLPTCRRPFLQETLLRLRAHPCRM